MSEYAWAVLVYVLLQTASLALLPRWWKLAAIPTLWVAVELIRERNHPSYMGDIILSMLMIYGCAYLVLVWVVLGMTRLMQRLMKRQGVPQRPGP